MPNHKRASKLAPVLNAAAAAAARAMPACRGEVRAGKALDAGAAFVVAWGEMTTVVLTEKVWLVKVPLWFVNVALVTLLT